MLKLWILSCSPLRSQHTNLRKNQLKWARMKSVMLIIPKCQQQINSACGCQEKCRISGNRFGRWSLENVCVSGLRPGTVVGCCLVALWWPASAGWWHIAGDAFWPPFPLTAICPHSVVAVASSHTITQGEGILGEKLKCSIRTLKKHLFSFKAGDFHHFRAPQDFATTKIN